MAQRLAQHLIDRGLLPARVVEAAVQTMAARGGGLDTVLLEARAVSEAGMLQSVSDVSGIRLVNLADFEPNVEAGGLLPAKLARQLRLTPLSQDGEALHVASAYPIPQNQLKDLGVLLGKRLELWVALECRIKDWQAVLYGGTLDPRFARLLASLDPSRQTGATQPPGDETLSRDVLERIAQGIVEEPVLLDRPKRRGTEGSTDPGAATLLETLGARLQGLPDPGERSGRVPGESVRPRAEEGDPTRIMIPPPLAVTPPRITFPGGVAPPRSGPRPPPRPSPATAFLQPAVADRPSSERRRPAVLLPADLALGLDPDLDFSDVDAALRARQAPARPLPPRFEELQALAATPPGRRPSSGRSLPRLAPAPAPAPGAAPTVTGTHASGTWADEVPESAQPRPEVLPEWLTETPAPPGAPSSDAAPTPPSPGGGADRPSRVFAVAAAGLLPGPPAEAPLGATPAPPALRPTPAGPTARSTPTGPPARPTPTGPAARPTPAGPAARPTPTGTARPTPTGPPARPAPADLAPAAEPILPAPPGLSASAAAGWSLAEARNSLRATVHDREEMMAVALDYGRRAFEFLTAFAVVKGAAVGWDARGQPGDAERVRGVAIPLDVASIFRTVAVTRGGYVGPLPPDALSRHYLQQLGRTPRTVFLWPVEVQSRLVALIYGDCGPRPVSQRRLADFILFCRELPAAFHELMLFRRQDPRSGAGLAGVAPPAPRPLPLRVPVEGDWFDGLLAWLTGPDPEGRTAAMQELLKTPEASARVLSHAFPGPSAWSRLPVTDLPDPDELGPLPGALARLGEAGARALAPLLDAPDPDTRYLALLTAGSLPFADVVDGVLRGLFELEPDLSSAARAAAAALRHLPAFQAHLPELRQELLASDPLRRSLAARALGGLHDRPSVEGLIALTGSDDGLCAQSAAEALKELTRCNLGLQPEAWARWWVGARDQRRVDWLVAALESEDFDLRLSAIEELSRAFTENLGYFADSPEAERAQAVDRWRAALAARPELEV